MPHSLTLGSSALLAALAVAACGGSGDAGAADTAAATAAAAAAQAPAPQEPILVHGAIVSLSTDSLVIKADTGNVTLKLGQPFHIYTQGKGSLADVKDSSFIGVTTVKQADGSEQATEIHVFPEDLRGLGEGSRMMAPRPNTSERRMTNGSVSKSQAADNTATPSRMSNGSVANNTGSSFTVQYAGGSQAVTVPPTTPVTVIRPVAVQVMLATGDTVTLLATRSADGSLSSSRAFVAGKK